jgi:3-oxoacyl-[acyl-carrier protein] reductase
MPSEQVGKLSDRLSIITGAAGGIGSGIARAYAVEGAILALVDRNSAGVAVLAEEIRAAGGNAKAFSTDLRDPEAITATFAQIKAELGPTDILVNNAGIDTTSSVAEMPVPMWDEMMDINLRSVFLCTRLVLPDMVRRRWGRIINTASQLAHKGAPDMAHYAAAKAGVVGFTRSLAYEVAADGVTVNAVCPGPIETQLLLNLPKKWLDRKQGELPIGRFGKVHEVVPAYVLLASDAGSYFIGSTLNMNGGDVMV